MALKDKTYADSLKGGGKYFKPDEHKDAPAILIEYKAFNPERPGYQGKLKPAVNVDLTVFSSDLSEQEIFKDQWLEQAALVGFLKNQSAGDDFIKKLVQLPARNGNKPAWAFEGVDSEETFQKVVEYYDNREKAITEALSGDDTPPWMQ